MLFETAVGLSPVDCFALTVELSELRRGPIEKKMKRIFTQKICSRRNATFYNIRNIILYFTEEDSEIETSCL